MATEDSVSLENCERLSSSVGHGNLSNMVLSTSNLNSQRACSNCRAGEGQDRESDVLNHVGDLVIEERWNGGRMRMSDLNRGLGCLYMLRLNRLRPSPVTIILDRNKLNSTTPAEQYNTSMPT